MADIYDWSTTAADNDDADSTINWLEGQQPGTVNGSARAMMKRVKEMLNDISYSATVAGTANAITATSAIAALADNKIITFKAASSNTDVATLAVNGLAAKAIRKISGGTDVALVAGDIAEGARYTCVYDSSANSSDGGWIVIGSAAPASATTSAQGIVELATVAEALAGTDAVRAVTPNGLYYPTGHLFGLTLTTNASDATNDIDIAAGNARDASDSFNYVLGSALTKRADGGTWVVGTNQPALDTGTIGNSRYAIWGIGRSDTQVRDVLFSTSFTAPTMPTNYDYKVLLGEFTRAGGVNGAPIWYGPKHAANLSALVGAHVILEDQKTSGTDGGTFTSGADRTRDLNTEVWDPNGYCTLSANQFTLVPGTYYIAWSSPCYAVDKHQTLMYNVTDTATVARGTSGDQFNSGTHVPTRSEGSCVVSITASKAFELRHRCQTTEATNGFGRNAGLGTEIYSRVEIWKVA